MPTIEWKKEYSVNVRKIDKQHKKIISILNDILNSDFQEKPQKKEKIIGDLINYIKTHFSTEEEYLREHNYPNYHAHKLEHEKFTVKICEYQKDYLLNKTLPVTNLFNFVWDWFAEHVLVTDKKYQLYFEQEIISK
ncbi:bacteriohemerythrin [Thermodesulfobacteriota bacterium]